MTMYMYMYMYMYYSFIPQMSPMYWTFLLIYTMLNMYMFMSLLYFSPSLSFNKFKIVKKYPKMNKKLIF